MKTIKGFRAVMAVAALLVASGCSTLERGAHVIGVVGHAIGDIGDASAGIIEGAKEDLVVPTTILGVTEPDGSIK